MLSQLKLHRDQILVLVSKDFKLKYNSTALGFAWSLIVPFVTSLVYYLVFGVIVRWDAENYLLYLISGTFLWQFFANVVMMNGMVMLGNVALLKKTAFDRRLLIWSTFFTESIHFLLTVPILIGMMLFYQVSPQWVTLLPNMLVVIMGLTLFSIGLSYAYAAANLYFRDLERIMTIVLMMWMFLSPVFIPIANVPMEYRWVYDYNPIACLMNIWRDIFYKPAFHPEAFLPVLVVSFGVFVLGRWIFMRLEARFAEMM